MGPSASIHGARASCPVLTQLPRAVVLSQSDYQPPPALGRGGARHFPSADFRFGMFLGAHMDFGSRPPRRMHVPLEMFELSLRTLS